MPIYHTNGKQALSIAVFYILGKSRYKNGDQSYFSRHQPGGIF